MTRPDRPPPSTLRQTLGDGDWNALEALLGKFEQAWAGSSVPELRNYAAEAGEAWRAEALRELIHADVEFRARRGEPPDRARYDEWLRDYPDIKSAVDSAAAKWAHSVAATPLKIGRYEVRGRAGRGATASVTEGRVTASATEPTKATLAAVLNMFTTGYASSPFWTSPSFTMRTGRLPGAISALSGAMPSWL